MGEPIQKEVIRPQCKHFVVRKKRYCKMTVKTGEEYCGEHQKPCESDVSCEEPPSKLRIVCPLDRKHTCYAHNLQKHLKICNARPTDVEPYISRGINSGREVDSINTTDSSYKLLSTFSVEKIKHTISKVKELYTNLISSRLSYKIMKHDLVEEEMSKPEYGPKTKKHLIQASSIVGLLQYYDLMKSKTCFIEFGAGRGQLSWWVVKATEKDDEHSTILLIERASPKHKRDNKLAKSTDMVKRIRADIADLVLDKVEIISNAANVVGVTKHLCGEATDLALRCLTNSKDNSDKIKGGVFTFCCHHRCRWISFTGKDFFKEHGLTKDDFDIMCGMASWATCGSGLSRELRNKEGESADVKQNERDILLGLDRKEKEEVGRQSKNVLNWGRLNYLEKMGFKCNLHYYVQPDITLENVCIVAYK